MYFVFYKSAVLRNLAEPMYFASHFQTCWMSRGKGDNGGNGGGGRSKMDVLCEWPLTQFVSLGFCGIYFKKLGIAK